MRKVRTILSNQSSLNNLLPVAFAFLPLLWTYPFSRLLYGIDYINVVNPFVFNHSPLALYYAPSSISSNEYIRFFQDTIFSFLNGVGLSYGVAERIVIIIGTGIAVFGVFNLLGTLNRINGFREEDNIAAKSFAALFFITNPFSMTVAWPFLENWTIFLIFLPFWLSLLLDSYYFENINGKKLFMVCIFGILLAPGVAGPFSVALLISLMFFFLLEIVRAVRTKKLSGAAKRILALSLVYCSTLWVLLPFFLYPIESGSRLIASPDVALFHYQSFATSVPNIVRLMGFNWIYLVPDKYAWISYLNMLNITITIEIVLTFIGLLWVRRYKSLSILVPFALIILFLMKGYQPPFENVNLQLFLLGGPFHILTNAYYFVGQYYVVFLSILVFALLSYLIDTLNKSRGRRVFYSLASKAKVTVLFGLIGSMIVSAAPFWLNQIYQPSGSNIDAFELPSSFTKLKDFLDRNYEGPNYFALILPLSSVSDAYYLSFNNNSFADSTGLLGSFVPYPIVSSVDSEKTAELINVLASNPYYVNNLLDIFGIKYVIINPFFQSSKVLTNSPDGTPFNWEKIVESLDLDLGSPEKVGDFLVYANYDAKPVVRALSKLNLVKTSSYYQYLQVVSSVDPSSLLGCQILDSLWTNETTDQVTQNTIVPYNYLKPHIEVNVPSSSSVFSISDNGTSTRLPLAVDDGNLLQFSSPLLESLEDEHNYLSNLKRSNSSFYTAAGSTSFVEFSPKFSQPLQVCANFRIEELMEANWVRIRFSQDNVSLSATIYCDKETEPSTLEFHAANTYPTAKDYTWKSLTFPAAAANDTIEIVARISGSELTVNVFANDSETPLISGKLIFAGTESELALNQGYNLTASPSIFPDFSKTRVGLDVINPKVQVINFSIYKPLPTKYLLVTNSLISTGDKIEYVDRVLYNGNHDLKLYSKNKSLFILVDYSNSNLWNIAGDNSLEVTRTKINPFTNVFYVNGNNSTSAITELSVQFQSVSGYMITFSAMELLAFSLLYTFYHYFRRKIRALTLRLIKYLSIRTEQTARAT